MRNWITFFTILIVQKEFTVSLLCYCLSSLMFRKVERLFEARFETWSENSSRTGLMRIAPCFFPARCFFTFEQIFTTKNFQTRCFLWVSWLFGFSERLGTYLTVILWLKSGRFTAIFGGDACHPHRTGAHIGSFFLVPRKMARLSQKNVENVNSKTYEMF